ncbi:exocyst complex component 3-like protein 2 [Phascolarctos cinereus]|uniref:Tumor necrosis factor alpha-induced protein 2-like n=1 Tax=Phascolarctos cinereus TaxID=38626 RepID=A0A6P5JWI2_PHACI|nr:tumor necrosis factor alpha-induced protein 2-like [Phascolarctos cinereus]
MDGDLPVDKEADGPRGGRQWSHPANLSNESQERRHPRNHRSLVICLRLHKALCSRLLEDMGAVRIRLAPAYPASLGAFGVYLQGYHGALSDWLRKATYHWLPLADRYALLYWHNQVDPREILGMVNMVALDNGQLGPLLPAETVWSL